MNKKALTETDIRSKFITPALLGANGDKWNLHTQIREEVSQPGRVIVRGKTVKRGEAKKADYTLSYKPNLPLAVIEAKDNTHAVSAGMQQAREYAEILDVPFAYSSKSDAFRVDRNILADQTKTSDFKPYGAAMTKTTNRTVDMPSDPSLRAQRSNPVTLPGFQTRHTRASKVAGLLRRYAPRNDGVLRLWTMYQAVTGTEEKQNIYKQFSPGFFDLVIIDECHRGSAADDAAWKVGRKPRAEHKERAAILPRGFRHCARGIVKFVVQLAPRWKPNGEAVQLPPYIRKEHALRGLCFNISVRAKASDYRNQ